MEGWSSRARNTAFTLARFSDAFSYHLQRLGDPILRETAPVFGRRAKEAVAQVGSPRGLRGVGADCLDLAIEELADLDELGRPEVDAAGRRLVAENRRDLAAGDHGGTVDAAVVLVAVLQAVGVHDRRPDPA